jgi:hypothetical protein
MASCACGTPIASYRATQGYFWSCSSKPIRAIQAGKLFLGRKASSNPLGNLDNLAATDFVSASYDKVPFHSGELG